ncbi:MAG: tetratricopeptide repeat protein [candidate division WOR-3 bacterium]
MFKSGAGDFRKIKLDAQKLIGQGKYQEALNKLIELSKQVSDPEVYNSIGDLYIRFQNNELALQYLEQAYKIYKEQDFREIAISVAKKILRIDKDRYDIYLDLVEMELENGNIDKALDWALELLKLPAPDPIYVGRLFRLVNTMANAIQENTEQATKFERLFTKLQELAEQISLTTLEVGIEFEDAKELFEKGDFGGYGGFFESTDISEHRTGMRTTRRKEEQESVEKVEFLEKDELSEEKGFITASGFSDFLVHEKTKQPEKTVLEEEPLFKDVSKDKIEVETSEKTRVEFDFSEKTQLIDNENLADLEAPRVPEEGPGTKVTESLKTIVDEELPEEIEEQQKVWESVTSRKVTGIKIDSYEGSQEKFDIGEGGKEGAELQLKTDTGKKSEEFREALKDFEMTGKGETRELLKDFIKQEFREDKVVVQELIKNGPGAEGTQHPVDFSKAGRLVAEKEETLSRTKEVISTKISEETRTRTTKLPDSLRDLLKVIRDFKEDFLSFETWPYSSDSPFEAAKEYYEMGLFQPAIEEFQKLLSEPRYRLQSLIYLGRVFFDKGELEFAEAVLRRAIEESNFTDKEYIDACYYLALTLEAMKRYGEAKELFMKVYIFDSRYRDVQEKIKTLRSRVI